ncbi:proton pump-interactor BIP103 [Oryza glaberrima]|uniref:Proton pump-interactor 1 n=2 Tax=Oryza TaxID=4527 RepID=A0A0D3H5M7_9ORYZ|nr:proton pump-interactor BIP103 [Oryza glaberrima]XP_052167506.1 proton pump-interactor BIP103 [Oryza glaberrima]
MGMEVVGTEAAPAEVKVTDGEVNLFQENESKATAKEREEAVLFGSDNSTATANGASNGADLAPPKDAEEDWPEARKTHSFFFVKIRLLEDPKLKMKIDQAEKDFQKKIQARSQIFEAIKAKKNERFGIISELKPLAAENKQYNEAVSEKLKAIEPLRNRLGKFRDENNAIRAQGAGICSSIEELEKSIKRLNDRISHESIPLDEEKRLIKQIRELEKTRPKVISTSANRAQIQDTVVERDAIQDQVKIIGEGIDGVKKERQAVRSKIKVLEDELKAIDMEMGSLQEDLTAATARKDKAHESLVQLRHARDAYNASFHQNRQLLSKARDLASRSELAQVQELYKTQVDKFVAEWCNSKAFREDYEKRILSSLNSRQLSRDGRMRNPDEKPIFIETEAAAPPVEQEPIQSKMPAKQAKEAPAPQAEVSPKDESHVKATAKPSKAKSSLDVDDDYEAESPKEKPKPKEVDVAKLKEIKRQEEMEKNRLALERKKKLAEKQAAKAAARAQKEAEKKLKREEMRARRRAGAADTEASTESDNRSDGAAEAQAEDDSAPASAPVMREQRESVRYSRNVVTKSKAPLPKAILRRKKAQSYWSWAGPAAAVAAALVALLAVLGYYQYYLPASASN